MRTAVAAIARERTTSAVAWRRRPRAGAPAGRAPGRCTSARRGRARRRRAGRRAGRAPRRRRGQLPGAVAQVVAGGVRAGDGKREQDEPDGVAHLLPVGGDEADHAEADGDRADHGERRRRAAAPRLLRVGVSTADRSRLLGRDDALSDPRFALAAQLLGEGAIRHLLRCRRLRHGPVGDVDERCVRVALLGRDAGARAASGRRARRARSPPAWVAYTVQPPMKAVSRHSSLCSPSRRWWM